MNRREMNQFRMMKTVVNFFDENNAQFTDKPALAQSILKLKQQVDTIDTHSQEQSVDTTVETVIKDQTKEITINATLKVAAGIAAHAAATADVRLKNLAAVTHTKLSEMRQEDFINTVRHISEAAIPLATQLAVWGVTPADIVAINTHTTNFMQKAPAIRNIKAKTIQATSEIKTTIAQTNTLLKENIDPMMLPFKILNPTLHGQYLTARVIIDLAAGHKPTTTTDTKPQ
jgi:hypothetical protein